MEKITISTKLNFQKIFQVLDQKIILYSKTEFMLHKNEALQTCS
jgi:hypothetical protein